jgi:NADPH-dependent glutamate synthase beta subunit-like oxidoreductase
MYYVDYANRALAEADYARLGDGASACLTCTHQACRAACPFDLPIPEFTRDAAIRLG